MTELENDEKLIVEALRQNPHAVLITDLAGDIVYANPGFCSMTGFSLEEVIGKNPRILSYGKTPPEIYHNLWQTVLAGNIWHGELLNKRRDGEGYWEAISIGPIRNASGSITHFVGIWTDSTQRKRLEEKVNRDLKQFLHQSITDELTGRPNRRHLLAELEKEIERAQRYGRQLAGMMLDIDDFKQINDRHGHLIGDRVLRTFAFIISKSIRKVDILGRYGGDEFMILLPETAPQTAELVAARIRQNLEIYQRDVLHDFGKSTASIGLVSFAPGMDKAAFIERADRAMMNAKRLGKNQIFIG